jgi:hypothetical protein
MTGITAARFGSSRADKAASWAKPVFETLFAACATLFCACGAAAPKIADTSHADFLAPSALNGIKTDKDESALDLERTKALLATYLCPVGLS